jgi:hypothetical protein
MSYQRGASLLLKLNHPTMFVECHGSVGYNGQMLFDLIRELGYPIYENSTGDGKRFSDPVGREEIIDLPDMKPRNLLGCRRKVYVVSCLVACNS